MFRIKKKKTNISSIVVRREAILKEMSDYLNSMDDMTLLYTYLTMIKAIKKEDAENLVNVLYKKE